ncbi:unnamed protein product [Arctia plantaginis]|uniref:Uncharacterized protein n=1 Tax=Arctia plantaginis TaxID=874455 RepID=A0A8S1BB09_ARCPL|nr:unnamed protein product [Arctia plantaginis]
MRSTEMYIKIVCFVFLYNTGLRKYATGELIPSQNPLDKPFAELPCLTIGGICAGEYNCPKNSRVPIKGLCPLQQKEGIECCKHENPILRCRSRGGNCESIEDIQCPQFFTVKEATDCGRHEAKRTRMQPCPPYYITHNPVFPSDNSRIPCTLYVFTCPEFAFSKYRLKTAKELATGK